jgi:hypothetical protein
MKKEQIVLFAVLLALAFIGNLSATVVYHALPQHQQVALGRSTFIGAFVALITWLLSGRLTVLKRINPIFVGLGAGLGELTWPLLRHIGTG